MAAVVANSAVGTGANVSSCTTAAITSSATGSTFLIGAAFDAGALPASTATDSKGNTYTLVGQGGPVSGGTACFVLYKCENGVGGSGHTGTFHTNGTTFPAAFLIEVRDGGNVVSVDSGSLVTGSDATSPYTITSGTFNAASTLALTFCAPDWSGSPITIAESTGWTSVIQQTDDNNFYGGAVFSKALSGTTALTPSFTGSGTSALGFGMIILGLKTASSSPALTGNSSTLSLSSVSLGVGISKGVTGNTITSSVTTAQANVQVALTGVSSATSVGTVSTGPPALHSVAATGSVTSMAPGFALALSGNSATGSVSNVAAGISATPSAVSSAGTVQGFSQTGVTPAPLGPVTGTCSVGSVTPGIARALAAVSSATSVTSVGANVSVALTGVSSTCTVGTLYPPGNALAGVSATGAVGSLSLGVAKAISGVSGTSTPGSVKSTPQRVLTAVQGTGAVGNVVFGNVVVRLGGVTTVGIAGNLSPPTTPDFANGERFFAEMMALPPFYAGVRPAQNQRGAIFYDSGAWTVPLGATNVFIGATARGGTPLGNAGDQLLQWLLPVAPGDTLTVQFASNGDVYVFDGSTQLVYLRAGAAYGKIAWQATWGQQSGLPGGFGSGVDVGTPFPPLLVFYWN